MNPQTPFPANRRTRVAAFVIDHILLSLEFAAVVFLCLGPNFIEGKVGKEMTTIFPPLAFLIMGIYFAKDSVNGASPGKWLFGLRVRDADNPNETPSFARLLLRNLFLIIWPVELIVLALSAKKKRLGDTVAKATVVSVSEKPKLIVQLTAVLLSVTAFVTFILFFVGAAMKSSDSYKIAIATIEYDQQIRNETGGIKGYGLIPAGNVSVSDGFGQAQYEIKVLGNKKDMKVWVALEKEPKGAWRVIGLQK